MKYDPGVVDGKFGEATRFALYAFQKVNGLEPTGVADAATRKALANPKAPAVLVPEGSADRVEVSIGSQILTVYVGGELALVSHISTGSGKSYCVEGDCSRAVTPKGDYKTTWRVDGWRTSRLGKLYNPVYFNGGIAVHGYPSVPLHPASHGCVRIPMHTATVFPGLVGTGEPVYVR
jgi:lipoprotein-anchoring transpeptidase ErfK/SrfK